MKRERVIYGCAYTRIEKNVEGRMMTEIVGTDIGECLYKDRENGEGRTKRERVRCQEIILLYQYNYK
jgi:hypothetical protein